MNEPGISKTRIVLALLEQIANDGDAGVDRTVADYQRLFPGHEETIAQELAGLREQAGESDADDLDIEQVGAYKTIELIGRGGQATVYLAEDTRLQRRVALKILRGLGAVTGQTMQRFRREAEVTSKLDHPGICPIFEAGLDRGTPFIAMRYIEGETLAEHIRRAGQSRSEEPSKTPSKARRKENAKEPAKEQPPVLGGELTPTKGVVETVRLFEELARALHVAHEAGIVHRDIKPGNIMLSKDGGGPVILDFGMAGDESTDLSLTQSGDVFGTPAYLSPEQLGESSARPDRRTDVYSLGVSLYECLTLQQPFQAPTRNGLYDAIRHQRPPAPTKWNRRIPRDLEVLLEVVLDKNPDRRYQTAEFLAEDLRRIRERKPILARPIPRWLRTQRWVQRNRTASAVLLLVVVALVLSLSLLVQQQEMVEQQGLALRTERNLIAQKDAALRRAEFQAHFSASEIVLADDPVSGLRHARDAVRLESTADSLGQLQRALLENQAIAVWKTDRRNWSWESRFSADGQTVVARAWDCEGTGPAQRFLVGDVRTGKSRVISVPDTQEPGPNTWQISIDGRCLAAQVDNRVYLFPDASPISVRQEGRVTSNQDQQPHFLSGYLIPDRSRSDRLLVTEDKSLDEAARVVEYAFDGKPTGGKTLSFDRRRNGKLFGGRLLLLEAASDPPIAYDLDRQTRFDALSAVSPKGGADRAEILTGSTVLDCAPEVGRVLLARRILPPDTSDHLTGLKLVIWDLAKSELIPLPEQPVVDGELSPKGDRLLVTTRRRREQPRRFELWDLKGHDCRVTHLNPGEGMASPFMQPVPIADNRHFAPDGEHFVTMHSISEAVPGPPMVCLWGSGGELIWNRMQSLEGCIGAFFSPDSRRLVLQGGMGWIDMVNLRGIVVGSYRGHTRAVIHTTFSPDGKRFASAGIDGTLRVVPVWDPATFMLETGMHVFGDLFVLDEDEATKAVITTAVGGPRLHRTGVEPKSLGELRSVGVALSPDRSTLLVCRSSTPVVDPLNHFHQGSEVDVFETDTGNKRPLPIDAEYEVASVAWFPDGRRILIVTVRSGGQGMGEVRLLNGGRVGQPFEVKGVFGSWNTCAVSKAVDGKSFLAIRSGPHDVHVRWGIAAKSQHSWNLRDPSTQFPLFFQFSPSGGQLAVLFRNGGIRVWEFDADRSPPWYIRSRHPGQAVGWSLTYSPNGRYLAVDWRQSLTGTVFHADTLLPAVELKPRRLLGAMGFTKNSELVIAIGDGSVRRVPLGREELLKLADAKLELANRVESVVLR